MNKADFTQRGPRSVNSHASAYERWLDFARFFEDYVLVCNIAIRGLDRSKVNEEN